jgi:hypothetical protein
MNIGDLVEDDWGQIAIVTSQVGVTDRWRIVYIQCGTEISAWGSNLYPIRS